MLAYEWEVKFLAQKLLTSLSSSHTLCPSSPGLVSTLIGSSDSPVLAPCHSDPEISCVPWISLSPFLCLCSCHTHPYKLIFQDLALSWGGKATLVISWLNTMLHIQQYKHVTNEFPQTRIAVQKSGTSFGDEEAGAVSPSVSECKSVCFSPGKWLQFGELSRGSSLQLEWRAI